MTVRMKAEGVPKFSAALRRLGNNMSRATRTAVNENLSAAVKEERRLLREHRHPRGTPTGSAPGSPPWRISGDLARSVRAERASQRRAGVWAGEMGPTAVYSRIHELGGVTGRGHRTHLPPRPHLAPAWRTVQPTMREVFVRHWARAQQL